MAFVYMQLRERGWLFDKFCGLDVVFDLLCDFKNLLRVRGAFSSLFFGFGDLDCGFNVSR